jgi:hypothetical protein
LFINQFFTKQKSKIFIFVKVISDDRKIENNKKIKSRFVEWDRKIFDFSIITNNFYKNKKSSIFIFIIFDFRFSLKIIFS